MSTCGGGHLSCFGNIILNNARETLKMLFNFDDESIDIIKEARDMVGKVDGDIDSFIRVFLPRMLHANGVYGMMQDVVQVAFLLKLVEEL